MSAVRASFLGFFAGKDARLREGEDPATQTLSKASAEGHRSRCSWHLLGAGALTAVGATSNLGVPGHLP